MASLFALDVDTKEIQNVGTTDVITFQNYTGPHLHIDSAAAITSIGTALGRAFASRRSVAGTAGDPNRYYVIHAIDPSTSEKLDADILMLGAGVGVDHIDNVRRIISGYLRQSYGYSASDAATLATFITVYNAVYRGKLSVFTDRYKDVVTKNLTADKVGIAINYKDWPGNTQLVIPLSNVQFSSLSTIDTSIISDKTVVDSLRTEDDKGIDVRKDMVDIKEREADIAADAADRAQKEADELSRQTAEQDALAQQMDKDADTAQDDADAARRDAEKAAQDAELARQQAEEAQRAADEAAEEASKHPKNKKAQNAAEEKQSEADAAAAEAQKKQQDADTKSEDATLKQEQADKLKQEAEDAKKLAEQQAQAAQAAADEAARAKQLSEEKQSEASADRGAIAKDMQDLLETEKANAGAPMLEGMILTNAEEKLSGIVRVNLDTGKVVKSSPVTVIRNRTLYDAGVAFIAIAGESGENHAIKLVQLDKNSMEIVKESDDSVSPDSVLVQNGSSYYCVIESGKSWVLAEYDAEITKRHVSSVTVDPSSPVTVTEKGIMVTGSDNMIKILSLEDLSAIK